MQSIYPLIQQLADGAFHSGESLAKVGGVSRAAIWKRIQKINKLPGLEVYAVPGKGYRLSEPLELLQAEQLRQAIGSGAQSNLHALEVLPQIESTNSYLLAAKRPPLNKGIACITEYQTGGKGRGGKTWVSPFGHSLALSVAWSFQMPLGLLSGLSLAVGAVVAEVLTNNGISNHCLKWPNDVHIEGKKLAGILVEAGGEMGGPSYAVIGVGINLSQPKNAMQQVDQPWTNLAEQASVNIVRNKLAAELIKSLLEMCKEYQIEGLPSFLQRWKCYDRYIGKRVKLILQDRTIAGQYVGLDAQGGLILDTAEGRTVHYAGEVSMRAEAVA